MPQNKTEFDNHREYQFTKQGKIVYSIGHLPGRKRVALCRRNHGGFMPIAYFRSDEEAQEFAEFLISSVNDSI